MNQINENDIHNKIVALESRCERIEQKLDKILESYG